MSGSTFVLVRGAQVSDLIFGQHQNLFARYGSTETVDWNSRRFSRTAVINGMVNSIPPEASTVVFVGVSMGGLLSYDAAQQMRLRGDGRPIKFILVDAPTGRRDLYHGSVANFIGSLPLGETANRLAPAFWRATFRPSLEGIHPRDVDQLEALWEVMRHYPLSGIKGEYGYITTHPALTAISNSSAVFIQSTNDNIVRPGAVGSWRRQVFPSLPQPVPVTCTHGSLLDEPDRYDVAFREALRLHGIA